MWETQLPHLGSPVSPWSMKLPHFASSTGDGQIWQPFWKGLRMCFGVGSYAACFARYASSPLDFTAIYLYCVVVWAIHSLLWHWTQPRYTQHLNSCAKDLTQTSQSSQVMGPPLHTRNSRSLSVTSFIWWVALYRLKTAPRLPSIYGSHNPWLVL